MAVVFSVLCSIIPSSGSLFIWSSGFGLQTSKSFSSVIKTWKLAANEFKFLYARYLLKLGSGYSGAGGSSIKLGLTGPNVTTLCMYY